MVDSPPLEVIGLIEGNRRFFLGCLIPRLGIERLPVSAGVRSFSVTTKPCFLLEYGVRRPNLLRQGTSASVGAVPDQVVSQACVGHMFDRHRKIFFWKVVREMVAESQPLPPSPVRLLATVARG